MTIKITIQDAVSDLFEVTFRDDYANYLAQFVTTEPLVNAKGEVTGSRYVMKHADLATIMSQMAL